MQSNQSRFLNPKHKIIGHRGAAGIAPENTLASFNAAKKVGLNCIEFDIQLCASNEWIVIHDNTLERTTNGQGLVQEKTLQELKCLDAGSWFDPLYQDQKIPTLLETFYTLNHLELQANIEIKGDFVNPEKSAKQFLDFLNEHWPTKCGHPLISSFNLEILVALKNHASNLHIGYIVDDFTTEALNITQYHEFFSLHCDYQQFEFERLHPLNNNVPLMFYTINEANIAKRFLLDGVYAIFSDFPNKIIPIAS